MKLKTCQWKPMTGRYSNGKDYFVGKIKVASVFWNGVDRDPKLRYIAECKLIGVYVNAKFPTEEEAITHAEKLVDEWFREVLI